MPAAAQETSVLRSLLLCILLLVVAAPAAAASERAMGDGYQVQAPDGYERVDVQAADDPMLDDVLNDLPVGDERVVHTFFKGEKLAPEGVLVVTRRAFTGALPENPLARIEERLKAYRVQLDGADIQLRRRPADGYIAVEMSARIPASANRRRGAQHVHVLVVPSGSFVVIVYLSHPAIDATPTSDEWESVVGSLTLGAPQEALRRLVVWLGISLGALVVFLLLVRILRGRPSGKRVDFSRAGETLLSGPSAYEGTSVGGGPGVTRAHDGLPTFHGGAAPPGGAGAPAVTSGASAGGSSLPGLKSTFDSNARWKKKP